MAGKLSAVDGTAAGSTAGNAETAVPRLTMKIFTAAEGNAAVERLATEQQAIVESLIKLEDHLGRRLLDNTVLAGVTRQRRADVLDGFARLWALHETYVSAVGRVREIMGRRSRPTRADLREVEELVTGATVALPNPDGLLPGPQVTLDGLVAEIHAVYGRVHGVVTAVDQVWAELSPRFDRCDTLLREAQTLAADLGLSADQDQAAAGLTRLADRLGTVRRIALTDPLRLWVDDAVDGAEVDQLISRCVAAHADLYALGELRQHAPHRLDQVDTTLTEARRLAQEISAEHRRVGAKIHIVPGPERVAQPADPLGPRLTAAIELCRRGRWQRLATDLPALEREAAAALARAQDDLVQAGQPLRERGELRGRLSAYRAKAARLGRIEDLALEQCYLRAHDLLWRAPCDLAIAAAAVAEYQDAVNGTVTKRTVANRTVANGDGA